MLPLLSRQGPPEPASPQSSLPAVPAHSGQVRTGGLASLRSDRCSCSAPPSIPFQSPPRRKPALGEPTVTCSAFSQPPKGFACVPWSSYYQRKAERAAPHLGSGKLRFGVEEVCSRQHSELGAEPDQCQPLLAPYRGLKKTLP